MKPYNEQEYNKLCAEFLGGKIKEDGWNFCLTDFGVKYCGYGFHEGFELKFHSDWNWIMEMVEAIEKLKFRFEIALNEVNLYCISEEKRFSCAINYHDCENYGEEIHLTKKEAVVQAINQFIDWYNKQKES